MKLFRLYYDLRFQFEQLLFLAFCYYGSGFGSQFIRSRASRLLPTEDL
jgi:hypothetical protein